MRHRLENHVVRTHTQVTATRQLAIFTSASSFCWTLPSSFHTTEPLCMMFERWRSWTGPLAKRDVAEILHEEPPVAVVENQGRGPGRRGIPIKVVRYAAALSF